MHAATAHMQTLRALSPASRRAALQAMPRAALQRLAKESGQRVRCLNVNSALIKRPP